MSDIVNPDSILLTEDGHPIGELVISDGSSCNLQPPVGAPDENREDMLRRTVTDLVGADDADTAVAELYPGYGDSDKRRKAMTAYVVDGKSIDDAAAAAGVPGRTVAMWVYNGQWDVLAKKELAARQTQSVIGLARLRADRRLEIAREQFDQAKMIRDKAARRIREDEGSLKSNTEAWTAAAKVEHTLSGVSEAGAIVDTEDAEKEKSEGKRPLVMVFQGGLPPVRRHE